MKNFLLALFIFSITPAFPVSVSGDLCKYGQTYIDIQGPASSETGSTNPFIQYKVDVTVYRANRSYTLAAFFNADGDPANTSANSGTYWRAIFTAPDTGMWTYFVTFLFGPQAAIDGVGVPVGDDGSMGQFHIAPVPSGATGFMRSGPLRAMGLNYLQLDDSVFIKGGLDSPENFLGYYEFDNTIDNGGGSNALNTTSTYTSGGNTYAYHGDGLHHFDRHLQDWTSSDPSWGNGKGKRIIGAINYLASQELNFLDILSMNINGDGREVYPYVSYNGSASPQADRQRFDCSKLAQWYIVIQHANRKGIAIQFKLQEIENDDLLDGGNLGIERKLYYREMVARFGSLPGIEWNMGEEYDAYIALNDPQQNVLKSCVNFINALDAYDHNIVVHTYPNQWNAVYGPMIGSQLTGAALQVDYASVHSLTKAWLDQSSWSWVVANDEQGSANDGLRPDGSSSNWDNIRKYVLWGNLMAGGGGVNYYFGYAYPHTDLSCEDFSSRALCYPATAIARKFFSELPFGMRGHDELVGNPGSGNSRYCFAIPGNKYVIYLPGGGGTSLDFSGYPNTYKIEWMDPVSGTTYYGTTMYASGNTTIGTPPNNVNADWVAIVSQDIPLPVIEFPQSSDTLSKPGIVVSSSDGSIFVRYSHADPSRLSIYNASGSCILSQQVAGDGIVEKPVTPGIYLVVSSEGYCIKTIVW